MSIPRIAAYPMPDSSQVQPSKVNWQADASRTVLLVHDMQDYFLNFYDRTAAPVPELIANIQRIKQLCQTLGIPVVYTAQTPEHTLEERGLLEDMWGPGIRRLPEQKNIIKELTPNSEDTVLIKWRYSAFQHANLQQLMHSWGRDQLIVVGIYANIGCMATSLEAFMRDIQPFLLIDACADFNRDQHLLAMDFVAGRCGVALDTDTLLGQLQAQAQPQSLPNLEQLRTSLAELLGVSAGEIADDDLLVDWGMDSIRMMSLLEQWQSQGADISFADLAENLTVAGWAELLGRYNAIAA